MTGSGEGNSGEVHLDMKEQARLSLRHLGDEDVFKCVEKPSYNTGTSSSSSNTDTDEGR